MTWTSSYIFDTNMDRYRLCRKFYFFHSLFSKNTIYTPMIQNKLIKMIFTFQKSVEKI